MKGIDSRKFENVFKKIAKNIDDIVAGTEMDLTGVSDTDLVEIITMALHCCLNGPVGVRKETTFPTILGKFSIKSKIECTNKSWKKFCENVKEQLNKSNPDIDCFMKEKMGEYWPNEYKKAE